MAGIWKIPGCVTTMLLLGFCSELFAGTNAISGGKQSTAAPLLQANEAAERAAKLANTECLKKFKAEPFFGARAEATLVSNRWEWNALAGSGNADFAARVSFNRDGSKPEIEVLQLVNAIQPQRSPQKNRRYTLPLQKTPIEVRPK